MKYSMPVHCCNTCAEYNNLKPKVPADSGTKPWLCEVCGHFGVGSLAICTIGKWLRLKPIHYDNSTLGKVIITELLSQDNQKELS